MKQTERIVRHLELFGTITSAEAMGEYGIYRLASRISDLKRMGYDIEREIVKGTNRFGESTHFARYSFRKEENINA